MGRHPDPRAPCPCLSFSNLPVLVQALRVGVHAGQARRSKVLQPASVGKVGVRVRQSSATGRDERGRGKGASEPSSGKCSLCVHSHRAEAPHDGLALLEADVWIQVTLLAPQEVHGDFVAALADVLVRGVQHIGGGNELLLGRHGGPVSERTTRIRGSRSRVRYSTRAPASRTA